MKLGAVEIQYVRPVPVTGLQYKCDPGLPITYTAFGFIILGVMLAAIPFRHVWVSVSKDGSEAGSTVAIGGRSKKAKVGFERLVNKLVESMQKELPPPVVATAVDPENKSDNIAVPQPAPAASRSTESNV